MDETYRIPERNLSKVKSKIEKLNRKATRLETPEIELLVGSFEDEEILEEGKPTGRFIRYYEVTVTGETPMLAGWKFVAVLEQTEGGNIVRTVPGEQLPKEYRMVDQHCDHCNLIRQRKDTYVVEHIDTCETKQVGSACLKDFTGGNDPHRAAAMAEFLMSVDEFMQLAEDDDFFGGGGSGEYLVSLENYLGYVSMMIRRYGWLSRGKARDEGKAGEATADLADSMMNKKYKKSDDFPTDDDKAKATAAIEWGREFLNAKAGDDPVNGDISDYEWNLLMVINQDIIGYRSFGLAASLLPFHYRELHKIVEKAQQAERSNEWLGEPKQRLQFDNLEVVFEQSYENDWGITILYKFVDEVGNELIWWASKWQDFEVGNVVSGKATVKKHEVYKDRKQTVINRAKFTEVIQEAA